MDLRQLKHDVLQYLFDGYVEYGGGLFTISEVTAPVGVDSLEFGSILLSEGLVKDPQFRPNEFVCSISTPGIMVIKPNYFNEHCSRIISTLGVTGGDWMGIMEILDFEPKDFQRAFDIAKILENSGYVEAQFQHNEIFLKLNLRGRQYYEDNKATFN